jgi:hypothetical protein
METWNNYTIYPLGYEVLHGIDIYVSLADENYNNSVTDAASWWKKKNVRYEKDRAFGKLCVDEFSLIQRATHLDIGQDMTLEQTRLVEAKFGELKTLALAGSIIQARQALFEMAVDLLLPIELKNLFLNKIDAYLSQY